MIFSKLTAQFEPPPNRLYRERQALEAKKIPLLDLVSGNVSAEGIRFPSALLAQALTTGARRAHPYHPHPLGQLSAREAIARYYANEGFKISPEQIVLTPGTSLAYAYLFQALADPGDEILCPQPNYPLFNMIADAAHLKVTSYALRSQKRWTIDRESIEAARTSRTRALVLISPHNPTGAVATVEELHHIGQWAAQHSIPIISDEVFSPFLMEADSLPRAAATNAPLVLTLNGFSKMLALPGAKLGWIAVTGDPALVKKTLAALEMISDTYLPVNEAVQAAVPILMKEGSSFLSRYQREMKRRTMSALQSLSKISEIHFIPPEGGFYVTLSIEKDEEEVCWELLTRHHMIVYPGFFYDLKGSHIILSTVHRPTALQRGLKALQKII